MIEFQVLFGCVQVLCAVGHNRYNRCQFQFPRSRNDQVLVRVVVQLPAVRRGYRRDPAHRERRDLRSVE